MNNRLNAQSMSEGSFTQRVCGVLFDVVRWMSLATLWLLILPSPPVHAAEDTLGKIVFIRVGDLWVMNPDGSHQQNIGVKGNRPSWSSDGTQLVFERRQALPPHIEIFVVNADGTNLRQLTKVPRGVQRTIQEHSPAWSPDGTQIAFTSTRDGDGEIYLMDADGQNQVNLTQSPETHDITPAWSPDGKKMVYYNATDGHLYIIRLKDQRREQLTRTFGTYSDPAWSPDGRQIAFDGARIAFEEVQRITSDLFIINADGSNERPLTDHPANDAHPTWSPDGTQLVFQSDRVGGAGSGPWNLYRLTIASGEIEQLTTNRGVNPDWNRPAAPPTRIGAAMQKWVRWGAVKGDTLLNSNR